MNRARWTLLLAITSVPSAHTAAQSWRLSLNGGVQHVEFRGLTADSVPEGTTVVNAAGGIESRDGFAVDCVGDGWCRFFRPGPIQSGLPASAGMDLTLWGLGQPGLSVHINTRAVTDLSGDQIWPGTSPTLRMVEGYAEYLHDGLTLQAGRTLERGRLASAGSGGLDGVRANWHFDQTGIDIGAYAGWGMARGTVLPVTSPAVDPLADYQPSARQIVLGVLAGKHMPALDVQAEYRRELDPITDYIVAERAALSMQARPASDIRIVAGADYDIAQGLWGSAEISASYSRARVLATLSARHYRPFFDLWTVWGVFSPVPFNGVSGELTLNPTTKLQIRSRAEWYRYESADASTPNVTIKDRGWRWALEGTLTPVERWSVELNTHGEFQPGASSSGIDGQINWRPRAAFDVSLDGGSLERPLELRFQDAGVTYAGAAANYHLGEQWRVNVAVDHYWDSRDRADAESIDWNQWRLSAGFSLTLRSAADRWLPPARPKVPPP